MGNIGRAFARGPGPFVFALIGRRAPVSLGSAADGTPALEPRRGTRTRSAAGGTSPLAGEHQKRSFWNGEEVYEEAKRIGETFVKELFWRMIFYIAIAATADICTINEGAIAPAESQSI